MEEGDPGRELRRYAVWFLTISMRRDGRRQGLLRLRGRASSLRLFSGGDESTFHPACVVRAAGGSSQIFESPRARARTGV